ncbi:hypothetical protein MRS44_013608 [Fusarium solani]|uniref:uncharacterized protein n=1 Tax=Fusarium solani TaxID=169388 RepID=UPI0032C41FD4|nr:hypothetical protein MRS44_013512 [Fusarium solani]KAJ3455008.1 hypothetical protein MRS44_013608 [Fusarium solani]
MSDSTTKQSASGESAAWKVILKDNSTWLKEMTKLGYRLHLLSSDFDKLHDQSQTPNASQVYLVLVVESARLKDDDTDHNDHPPLRERLLKELKTHDWLNEMGRDIILKQSGIVLNISTYYVDGYGQSPFADFTRLRRQKDTRLCAVTYGNDSANVTSWFFKSGYLFIIYEISGERNIWQFRPEDGYNFITQVESDKE